MLWPRGSPESSFASPTSCADLLEQGPWDMAIMTSGWAPSSTSTRDGSCHRESSVLCRLDRLSGHEVVVEVDDLAASSDEHGKLGLAIAQYRTDRKDRSRLVFLRLLDDVQKSELRERHERGLLRRAGYVLNILE